MHVDLAPHQQEAVKKLKNGSILWGGVGTGKSRTALAYYTDNETHKDLYVITTAKKRDSLDWEREAAAFGIGKEENASLYGKLTVDSWNNIGKYVNVRNALFYFDEQRLVGSGAWVKAFLQITKHNQWILLSATPGDTWLDYIPVFIANGFYKNRTQFKREHVVYSSYTRFPKVERYLNQGKLVRLQNQILVEMPYMKNTIWHQVDVPVDYDRDLYDLVVRKRWDPFRQEPIMNIAEMFRLMRRVVNSDESRMKEVRNLLMSHPRLIIFYNYNYELELLRELHEFHIVAEWNGHKHEEIPDLDRWVYLVQYGAGAEGWNCTDTDAMLFYSLPYSYRQFHQAHGRIDRMNTKYSVLNYYTLKSEAPIDRAISKKLVQKKSFNEKEFDFI